MKRHVLKDPADLERVAASALGAQLTKNSGSVFGDGDAVERGTRGGETYDQILVEAKFTAKPKKSVSFSKKDWNKLASTAVRFGRIPVLVTYTPDADGSPSDVFVHLRIDDFAFLTKRGRYGESKNR